MSWLCAKFKCRRLRVIKKTLSPGVGILTEHYWLDKKIERCFGDYTNLLVGTSTFNNPDPESHCMDALACPVPAFKFLLFFVSVYFRGYVRMFQFTSCSSTYVVMEARGAKFEVSDSWLSSNRRTSSRSNCFFRISLLVEAKKLSCRKQVSFREKCVETVFGIEAKHPTRIGCFLPVNR